METSLGYRFLGHDRPPRSVQNQYISENISLIFEIAPKVQLSESQKQHLEKVVGLFPYIAKQCLWETHVLQRVIDTGSTKPIKQRHSPVSTAVEKLIYAELNRMLELGVIEESSRALSSPVFFIGCQERTKTEKVFPPAPRT